MKYLLSGCTCSLEQNLLNSSTKLMKKKRVQIRPEKSFFTTNYNAFRALKHIKLKSAVSYLCCLADVTKRLKLCVTKKSMYISRQFLNSFDISVFTDLAWRNKFYLILSVFCYFFYNPLTCPKLNLQKATRIAIVRWSRFAILQRIFCVKSCQICHWGSMKTALNNNDYNCETRKTSEILSAFMLLDHRKQIITRAV